MDSVTQLELEVEPQITVTEGSEPMYPGSKQKEHYYEYQWNGKRCRTHVGPGLHENGDPLGTARAVAKQVRMDGGGFHTAFAVAALAGLKNGQDRARVAQWLGFDTFTNLMTHIFKIFEEHRRYERARRNLIMRVKLDLSNTGRNHKKEKND